MSPIQEPLWRWYATIYTFNFATHRSHTHSFSGKAPPGLRHVQNYMSILVRHQAYDRWSVGWRSACVVCECPYFLAQSFSGMFCRTFYFNNLDHRTSVPIWNKDQYIKGIHVSICIMQNTGKKELILKVWEFMPSFLNPKSILLIEILCNCILPLWKCQCLLRHGLSWKPFSQLERKHFHL